MLEFFPNQDEGCYRRKDGEGEEQGHRAARDGDDEDPETVGDTRERFNYQARRSICAGVFQLLEIYWADRVIQVIANEPVVSQVKVDHLNQLVVRADTFM